MACCHAFDGWQNNAVPAINPVAGGRVLWAGLQQLQAKVALQSWTAMILIPVASVVLFVFLWRGDMLDQPHVVGACLLVAT